MANTNLIEPATCQRCSKRAVRQAYHYLCSGSAKGQNVCSKCCCRVHCVIGRDLAEVEAEQKMLEEAMKNDRERDKRTLLRVMNKGESNNSAKIPSNQGNKGELFPDASLEAYAAKSRGDKDNSGDNIDNDVDDETGDGDYHDDEVENEVVDEDNIVDRDRVCN